MCAVFPSETRWENRRTLFQKVIFELILLIVSLEGRHKLQDQLQKRMKLFHL